MADANRSATRTVAAIAAIVLLVSSGFVHGYWTGRWGDPGALEAGGAALERVPESFGDWQGKSLEIDRRQLTQAEIDGYISRRYENQRDGRVVTVLLVCGRPGPISVHTPDVCYRGAGYVPAASPVLVSLDSESSRRRTEFWTARFDRQQSPVPESLQILWSWNAGGGWESPDYPRLRFATARFLYKFYVIRATTPADGAADAQACACFLRRFLPVLDDALFP